MLSRKKRVLETLITDISQYGSVSMQEVSSSKYEIVGVARYNYKFQAVVLFTVLPDGKVLTQADVLYFTRNTCKSEQYNNLQELWKRTSIHMRRGEYKARRYWDTTND